MQGHRHHRLCQWQCWCNEPTPNSDSSPQLELNPVGPQAQPVAHSCGTLAASQAVLGFHSVALAASGPGPPWHGRPGLKETESAGTPSKLQEYQLEQQVTSS